MLALIALCGLVLIPAKAAEPILTLAMAGADSFRRPLAVRARLAVEAPVTIRATAPVKLPDPRPALFETTLAPATLYLTKKISLPPANPILTTGRYLAERGHSKFWSNLTGGYGRVFYDHSPAVYGQNAWEQPACGYLKYSVRF